MVYEEHHVPQMGDDAGLQPKHTSLAWNRTLIAFAVAFGILGVHAARVGIAFIEFGLLGLRTAFVLALSPTFARRMSHCATEFMTGKHRFMPPLPLLALSPVATALGLGSFILILTRV